MDGLTILLEFMSASAFFWSLACALANKGALFPQPIEFASDKISKLIFYSIDINKPILFEARNAKADFIFVGVHSWEWNEVHKKKFAALLLDPELAAIRCGSGWALKRLVVLKCKGAKDVDDVLISSLCHGWKVIGPLTASLSKRRSLFQQKIRPLFYSAYLSPLKKIELLFSLGLGFLPYFLTVSVVSSALLLLNGHLEGLIIFGLTLIVVPFTGLSIMRNSRYV